MSMEYIRRTYGFGLLRWRSILWVFCFTHAQGLQPAIGRRLQYS